MKDDHYDPLYDPLGDLEDKVIRLRRAKDPILRNRLAVELLTQFRPALAWARSQAAQDAVAAGMRPIDYARAIGVTRGAVNHLLHRHLPPQGEAPEGEAP